MTSVREAVRRLRRRVSRQEAADSAFAYTVYWTKQVRTWDPARRGEVYGSVQQVVSEPDFVPNEFERRYRIQEIDDLAHAGASLVALLAVLEAFEES
jgi:hypothetical protein